ncbi:hypothetical protein H0H87_008258 [Tephrocybe sp. NHM501043]|nr:hypothetical protein H0H87_008258 [Tephrocybe sp. NHM501043]
MHTHSLQWLTVFPGAINCNSTLPQPEEADCDALVVSLNHVKDENFTAAPWSFTKFSLRTCSFSYTNYDRINPYDVCMVQFTMQALATDLVCRTAASSNTALAGKCTAPGGTNNTWLVE